MLACLVFFCLGSALSGAATNANFLIAARTVQGVGCAGLISLPAIVLSDVVSLAERAKFNSLLQVQWALATGSGPFVGAGLAQAGQWRWIFYLNLPIAGVGIVLVALFMRLKKPEGSFHEKIVKMDWIGNILIMGSSTALAIALTWGGSFFPWSSAKVLVPLIIGIVGLLVFMVYETFVCERPLVPIHILQNRTSFSGYLQILIITVPVLALIFYSQVYFQACKGFSPLKSALHVFVLTIVLSGTTIFVGLSIQKTQRYRPQCWIGWCIVIPALALLSRVAADTPTRFMVGYLALAGVGIGFLMSALYFPVLAPLPNTSAPLALSFFTFVRQFSIIWGITVGGAILQNSLKSRLPPSFEAAFPGGSASLALGVIPELKNLPPASLQEIRNAYAASLQIVWIAMTGLAGVGLLSSLMMRGLPLHAVTDKDWGIVDEQRNGVTSSDEILSKNEGDKRRSS